MAIQSLKWHIFNEHNEPLCWDDKALEFDTKESAERFLHSHVDTMYDSYEEYCETFGITFKECILYYDGGYFNATNKIVVYEEDDWEGHLEDME